MDSPTRDDVNQLKIKTAAKYHLEAVPSNADIITALTLQKQNSSYPS